MNVMNPHEIATGRFNWHHPQLIGCTWVPPRFNWPLSIHTGVSKVVVCQVKVRRTKKKEKKTTHETKGYRNPKNGG